MSVFADSHGISVGVFPQFFYTSLYMPMILTYRM